jgi:hypothetical protein
VLRDGADVVMEPDEADALVAARPLQTLDALPDALRHELGCDQEAP